MFALVAAESWDRFENRTGLIDVFDSCRLDMPAQLVESAFRPRVRFYLFQNQRTFGVGNPDRRMIQRLSRRRRTSAQQKTEKRA